MTRSFDSNSDGVEMVNNVLKNRVIIKGWVCGARTVALLKMNSFVILYGV